MDKKKSKSLQAFFHSVGHIVWMTLNLLAIICLLLADCSVLIAPTSITLPAILGLGFEWLLLVNIVFSLSWLFSSRKSWSLAGLAALILSTGGILSTFSHHTAQKADYEHHLTILSYNTHQMEKTAKSDKNDILRYIKNSGADVVFLQEYEVNKSSKWLTAEEARIFLKKEYPYTYFDFSVFNSRRQYGLAIYSKYPLVNKQTIHYESRANGSNYCDLLVNGDTLRLFNNHLESNRFTQNDLHIEEEEDLKGSALRVVEKLGDAYRLRAEQVDIVSAEIAQSPYPVIVAGDFNDCPVSYTYRKMSKGLNDSFLYGSWLQVGHTMIKHHLGVRIDYILTSKQFAVTDYKTGDYNYSDHQPVMATIAW